MSITRLAGAAFGGAQASENGLLAANWRMGDGTTLSLIANLSNHDIPRAADKIAGTQIWGNELTGSIPAWAVTWAISPRIG